jgi:ADP-ribose pyrophosphatase YjhB (NUDIX family)
MQPMESKEKDLYFIALKVFLERQGKFLILKDGYGEWDIPGGRLTKEEFGTSFEAILSRKMHEELGSSVRYSLGNPVVFMRHERVEVAPGNPTVRIFAVGYQATLEEGEVLLTSHHTEMLWADIHDFKPENYFTGGWLKGVQDYLELVRMVRA